MEFIRTDRDGELLVVTLARGKANALNAAIIDELSAAVRNAADDAEIRGLVLASDRPRFFSTGFDVAEVFAYERDVMTTFFGRFIDLYESLVRLPKPVVAAVRGHAFAGGAVLALACDLRIFGEGESGFALNEVNLGMMLPAGLVRLAINAVGVQHARTLILAGRTFTPAEALAIGLAHELTPPEAVLDRALARARELAQKPPAAFGAMKRAFAETTGLLAASDRQALGPFIDQWFSPEAMSRKRALTESMR